MADVQMARALPLAGKAVGGAGITLTAAPEAFRVNLRAGAQAVAALSKTLGVTLPKKPKTSSAKGNRHALWLGPDEWLVIDDVADPMGDCAKAKAAHSAVDVSHRNTAIMVSGPNAADVLSAGCPQDLSIEVFPVGACSRTVLGKIEIVLYRTEKDAFRVEVWRSYSDYAFAFLADAARGSS